jgi:hypothetical protein
LHFTALTATPTEASLGAFLRTALDTLSSRQGSMVLPFLVCDEFSLPTKDQVQLFGRCCEAVGATSKVIPAHSIFLNPLHAILDRHNELVFNDHIHSQSEPAATADAPSEAKEVPTGAVHTTAETLAVVASKSWSSIDAPMFSKCSQSVQALLPRCLEKQLVELVVDVL